MTETLALRLLSETMGWDDSQARAETAWVRLMSDFKYDGYREYLAGSRFIENLVTWLRQFPQADRSAAYAYVRTSIVFISAPEMQQLVSRFYPEQIEPNLLQEVAADLGVPAYLAWADERTEEALTRALRRTLFFGLSDGARMDTFRRANERRITNDQVAVAADIHPDKWDDMLGKLRETEGADARFDRIYLIDDFVGSGTTLLRWNAKKGKWAGRMVRFWESHKPTFATHLSPGWKLYVHHYITSYRATSAIRTIDAEARTKRPGDWFDEPQFSFGLILPQNLPLDKDRDAAMWNLTERFYDSRLETDATAEGGNHVRRGFGQGGLPLVLEHNTPNNSVALLWADTPGGDVEHRMRPLFRRAQRHW